MLTRFAITCYFVGLVACAHRPHVPLELRQWSTPQLLERMRGARTHAQSFAAEARISYFGTEGRLKGSATLLVQRPNRLRYNAMGPHGGVIEAFALDGAQIQLLQMNENRLVQGAATPENIDQLIGFLPLGLAATEWVALLFGEVTPPTTAQSRFNDDKGLYELRWPQRGTKVLVEVDPHSARPQKVVVTKDKEVLSEATWDNRDDSGLPHSLHVKAPKTRLEMELRDVEIDVQLADDAFRLEIPPGVSTENL